MTDTDSTTRRAQRRQRLAPRAAAQREAEHPTATPALAAATGQDRAVVVYSKPSCPQCDRTKAWLDRRGVVFTAVDVTTDPGALEYVTVELQYRAVPVVLVEDPDTDGVLTHWSGYRPDLLAAHVPTEGARL